jgi:hypothetical protein
MERTAIYQGKPVYVTFAEYDREWALISHYPDKSRQFKVDLKDLENLNFKLEPRDLPIDNIEGPS